MKKITILLTVALMFFVSSSPAFCANFYPAQSGFTASSVRTHSLFVIDPITKKSARIENGGEVSVDAEYLCVALSEPPGYKTMYSKNGVDYIRYTSNFNVYESGTIFVYMIDSVGNKGNIYDYNLKLTGADEIERIASNIVSNTIKPEMTELEKTRALFDYVVENMEYKENATISGVELFKGLSEKSAKGNCSHYSYALKTLLEVAGIESKDVSGYANGSHEWLVVYADGKWGNVDPTWEDADKNKDNWFFITDAAIAKTHKASICLEDMALYGEYIAYARADIIEKPVCK
jgi:hypothetical protein